MFRPTIPLDLIKSPITKEYEDCSVKAGTIKDGFGICKITIIEHEYDKSARKYYKHLYRKKTGYYCPFIKNGKSNAHKLMECRVEKWFDTIFEAIEFINKAEFVITESEYSKYVSKPNEKNEYGLSSEELLALCIKHSKADKKMQYLIEARLTEINFHKYCSAIASKQYRLIPVLLGYDVELLGEEFTQKEKKLIDKLNNL